METFVALKDLIDNPHYHEERQEQLLKLDLSNIDSPIIDIVSGLAGLTYCFTLQSCYGHFLHKNQKNRMNVKPLPISDSIKSVEYKIAYIGLCIQNNKLGRALFHDLREIPLIDPDYIQFGCAEWFWERQVNSYALQVEPRRYMTIDEPPPISYQEAQHIQKVRNEFFLALRKLIQNRL
ncbi:hypothetical protein ACFLW2_01570 [Chloroflexota bacterium]